MCKPEIEFCMDWRCLNANQNLKLYGIGIFNCILNLEFCKILVNLLKFRNQNFVWSFKRFIFLSAMLKFIRSFFY
jgi:hypothetical protein